MAGRKADYHEEAGVAQTMLEYDGEIVKRLEIALAANNTIAISCRLAGITAAQLYQWLKKGEAGEQPYADFKRRVEVAQATAEAQNVRTITNASRRDWKAAAWLLAKRNPQDWGEKRDDQNGEGGAVPIKITLAFPSHATPTNQLPLMTVEDAEVVDG